MTGKRFIDGGEECVENQFLIDTKTDTNYWIDNGLDDIIDLLNALHNENEQLKKQKARYKRLSEIRNEEINNRILTIKEFIDNCSNEEVKKTLEDLFYSEVNEYDLSKKYRKLHKENEIFRIFLELNDFDADEIIRQGRGLE